MSTGQVWWPRPPQLWFIWDGLNFSLTFEGQEVVYPRLLCVQLNLRGSIRNGKRGGCPEGSSAASRHQTCTCAFFSATHVSPLPVQHPRATGHCVQLSFSGGAALPSCLHVASQSLVTHNWETGHLPTYPLDTFTSHTPTHNTQCTHSSTRTHTHMHTHFLILVT